MKKFIVIYHAQEDALKKMQNATSGEHTKGMEPWMAWMQKVGDGMVDMGSPLTNGRKVSKSGTSVSDKQVVGYTILQANSMDDAVKLLEGHPHLDWAEGCEIEIHESIPMPEI